MNNKLKDKIAQFNRRYSVDSRPHYGNSFRIIVGTLTSEVTVTKAPNIEE